MIFMELAGARFIDTLTNPIAILNAEARFTEPGDLLLPEKDWKCEDGGRSGWKRAGASAGTLWQGG